MIGLVVTGESISDISIATWWWGIMCCKYSLSVKFPVQGSTPEWSEDDGECCECCEWSINILLDVLLSLKTDRN